MCSDLVLHLGVDLLYLLVPDNELLTGLLVLKIHIGSRYSTAADSELSFLERDILTISNDN